MPTDQQRAQFEQALLLPDPTESLRQLALKLKSEGVGQIEMYHLYTEFLQNSDSSETLYDAIADNLDLIWGGGWAKGRALFEKTLTNEDVRLP